MSTKTVIVWLVVAVLLGATALLVMFQSERKPATDAAPSGVVATGQPVLEFDPAKVERIRVERPDGTVESIERSGPADWTLTIRDPRRPEGSPPPAAWPLGPTNVQSLLRILSRTPAAAQAAPDSALGERPTIITIELEGSGQAIVRLAERTLAGTALVEVERTPGANDAAPPGGGAGTTGGESAETPGKRIALVSDQIHALFNQPGPSGWRKRTVFGDLADASRITLVSKEKRLALAKLDGQWSLREPFAAPADPAAVARLLATLQEVQIADFLDGGDAGARTGLENPDASVLVETDRRRAQPGDSTETTSVTERQALTIGTTADARATRVYASTGGESDPRLVQIEARALGGLPMEPAPYVWPHPTRLAPPDIGTVVLERHSGGAELGVVYKRRLDRWVEVRPDGSEVALADADLRRATALVEFLTGTGTAAKTAPAGDPDGLAIVAFSPPVGYSPVGRVTVLSLGDSPLEALEIGTNGQGGSGVTVKTGGVYRTYPPARVPGAIADLAAPSAPPPTADPARPAEPNK